MLILKGTLVLEVLQHRWNIPMQLLMVFARALHERFCFHKHTANAFFIHRMMNQPILTLSVLLSLLLAPFSGYFEVPPIQAQALEELDEKELKERKEHEKFVKEMETLIKAAQDSGFSQEDIRDISITRKGKSIVVWEFLEQEKIRREREERRRFVPRDRYLSVRDISHEMQSQETRKLDSLRKKMIFVGAEEQ